MGGGTRICIPHVPSTNRDLQKDWFSKEITRENGTFDYYRNLEGLWLSHGKITEDEELQNN